MAQYSRPAVLAVGKLVQEQVDRYAKWPEGEIADVFCKVEGGECDAEGEVSERRLYRSVMVTFPSAGTSLELLDTSPFS